MSEPRTFDLSDKEERNRLIREVAGYMKVSLHHGTDERGRTLAAWAMADLWRGIERGEYAVVRVTKKAPAPFVFDDEIEVQSN